jgi:hypothetical protein
LYENTQHGGPELVSPGMHGNVKFSNLGQSQLFAILIFGKAQGQDMGKMPQFSSGGHI